MNHIKKILLDLDDTLFPNTGLYSKAIQEFIDTLYNDYRFKEVYTKEDIENYREEIDEELVEKQGFSIGVFTESFELTYKKLAAKGGFEVTKERVSEIREIASVVDVDRETIKERGWKDQANIVLDQLYNSYELALITKGSEETQWRKIDTLGLTEWIDEEKIYICNRKTPDKYREVIGNYDAENVCMVGNSISSDCIPMAKAGGFAIHVIQDTWSFEDSPIPPNLQDQIYQVKSIHEIDGILQPIEITA